MSAELGSVDVASAHVREFANSDCSNAWMSLLDALCVSYKEDLVHADLPNVAAIQAQIRQLNALKHIVTGNVRTNGRT